MNIDQNEENFVRLIKCMNFLRVLAVDYQFDDTYPDYLGYINTIPADHGITDEEVMYIKQNCTEFDAILKPFRLIIIKADVDEFILAELVKNVV
jgi:hypothetical protein